MYKKKKLIIDKKKIFNYISYDNFNFNFLKNFKKSEDKDNH